MALYITRKWFLTSVATCWAVGAVVFPQPTELGGATDYAPAPVQAYFASVDPQPKAPGKSRQRHNSKHNGEPATVFNVEAGYWSVGDGDQPLSFGEDKPGIWPAALLTDAGDNRNGGAGTGMFTPAVDYVYSAPTSGNGTTGQSGNSSAGGSSPLGSDGSGGSSGGGGSSASEVSTSSSSGGASGLIPLIGASGGTSGGDAEKNASGSTGGATTSDRTTLASAVPEPGTWAMMLSGFFIVGMTLRRKVAHQI